MNNKKILVILGAVVAVVVLVSTVGYFLLLKTPSPQKVCDHGIEVLKKYLKDNGLEDSMKEEDITKAAKDCIEQETAKKEKEGSRKYKKYAGCILDTTKAEDFEKCENK